MACVNRVSRTIDLQKITIAGADGYLPKPSQPLLDFAGVVRQLDREFACKTSPGVKVAFGDADDDGNSAVDGARDQVAQATAFALDLAELVEDEKLRRMFEAALDPRRGFRQRRFVQTTSARAGAAVLEQRGAMAGGQILENDVASPVAIRERPDAAERRRASIPVRGIAGPAS